MPTVDFKDVAEYLRQEHPRQVEAIVREADDARGGRLVLPGTQARPYFTGTPPRWHDNPVRDDEYVWVLNRMFHWKTLLQAFALTGDRSFAERVLMELDDWLRQCPVPALSSDPGILRSSFNAATPWRSLEAGIRMYDAWPWMLDFLGHAGLLTPELRVRLAKAFRTHGRVLRHV